MGSFRLESCVLFIGTLAFHLLPLCYPLTCGLYLGFVFLHSFVFLFLVRAPRHQNSVETMFSPPEQGGPESRIRNGSSVTDTCPSSSASQSGRSEADPGRFVLGSSASNAQGNPLISVNMWNLVCFPGSMASKI